MSGENRDNSLYASHGAVRQSFVNGSGGLATQEEKGKEIQRERERERERFLYRLAANVIMITVSRINVPLVKRGKIIVA